MSQKDNSKPIVVFTDGACSNNGKDGAKAGIGIYFGKKDPRNVSKRIGGKQTNNTAELTAIICVATILEEEIENGVEVQIYSDSQYAIWCCTSYGAKCEKAGWRNPNDKSKPIPNVELVKFAYETYKGKTNVKFNHVMAHTGKRDAISKGNEKADILACQSIGVKRGETEARPDNRIYLNIPYEEKEGAKKMGAKWDPKRKKWYIMKNNKHRELMRLRWGLDGEK